MFFFGWLEIRRGLRQGGLLTKTRGGAGEEDWQGSQHTSSIS